MPLEHLHQRWHFHQRMNKKVWNNLERLKTIAGQSQSKQEILDALHPWRLSINLRFNNTFAVLQIGIGAILILSAFIFFKFLAGWSFPLFMLGSALAIYAYFSFEKQSDIDQVIQALTDKVYQQQYDIQYLAVPHTSAGGRVLNTTYLLARIRQGFNCLNEGNSGNNLKLYASTCWQINSADFPVLLFHYECIDEIIIRDVGGKNIKKRVISNRWGACVFNMPNLAFMVSTTKKTYPRYPVTWSTSDIQFNQRYAIAGQQELELARNLTPHRILALNQNLKQIKGTLMFHDEMHAFCYVSTQNIFATRMPNKPITDISMLRGYLRTLKAPHYERMQTHLSQLIQHFQDESYLPQSSSPEGSHANQ